MSLYLEIRLLITPPVWLLGPSGVHVADKSQYHTFCMRNSLGSVETFGRRTLSGTGGKGQTYPPFPSSSHSYSGLLGCWGKMSWLEFIKIQVINHGQPQFHWSTWKSQIPWQWKNIFQNSSTKCYERHKFPWSKTPLGVRWFQIKLIWVCYYTPEN